MSRGALIIGVPNARGHDHLPGALIDVSTWRSFLQTPNAGAWDPSEIVTLVDPTRVQVSTAVAMLRAKTFAFVAFSGHGCHLKPESGVGFDQLVLGDGSSISELDLNPGNGKTVLALDACRHVVLIKAFAERAIHTAGLGIAEDSSYRERCRVMFERLIEAATGGTCTVRGCSLDEAANEDSNDGGYFTFAMANEAGKWAIQMRASRTSGTLTLRDAFGLAATEVTRRDPNQHPVAQFGRRFVHFPFSVAP